MDVTTFQCPQCQALLRMRSRQIADSTFECPDCQASLQISQQTDGQWSVCSLETESTVSPKINFSRNMRAGWNTLRHYGQALLASPVLLSWVVAGTGAFLIVLMIILDQRPAAVDSRPATNAVAENNSADTPAATDTSNPTEAETEKPGEDEVAETDLVIPKPAPPPVVIPDREEAQPQHAAPPKPEPVLTAVKPDQIPPLVAQKPVPAPQPLVPATDVTLALKIPIVEFRQPEDVPLKTLMAQFEEMLDTKFQYAENVNQNPELMETSISISRKNITLDQLLTVILKEGALTYSVKSNKIHIERATPENEIPGSE